MNTAKFSASILGSVVVPIPARPIPENNLSPTKHYPFPTESEPQPSFAHSPRDGESSFSASALDCHIERIPSLLPCTCHFCRIPSRFKTIAKIKRTSANVRCSWSCKDATSGPSCRCCFREFAHKASLKAHLLRVHQSQAPFACSQCDKRFADGCDLSRHRKLVHDKVRPFTCNSCDLAFPSQSKLVVHERTHTGEKPFSCDLCGVSSATKSNLKRHIGRVHKK